MNGTDAASHDGGNGDEPVSSLTFITVISVLGAVFVVGISVSVYRCATAYRRSRQPLERSRSDSLSMPSTGIRNDRDPILSAPIVYIHDAHSSRRHSSSVLGLPAIVVDDVVGMDAMTWAQRMMSGNGDGVEKSQGSVHLTIPVEEAMYVEQPDGRHILAVSRRFKDSMLQVKPEDLGIAGSSRLERSSSVDATVSITPKRHGIVPLYGTTAIQVDVTVQNQKMRKKRRKRPVKYDAWCQASLDMSTLE